MAEGTRFEIHLPALRHNFQQIKKQLKPIPKFGGGQTFAYGSDATAIGLFWKKKVQITSVLLMWGGCPERWGSNSILVLHPKFMSYQTWLRINSNPVLFLANSSWTWSSFKHKKQKHFRFILSSILGYTGWVFDWWTARTPTTSQIVICSCKRCIITPICNWRPHWRKFTRSTWTIRFAQARVWNNSIYHVLNTSGVFNYPEAHHDMVDVGLGCMLVIKRKSVSSFVQWGIENCNFSNPWG